METLRSTVRQLEAKNQELQRQTASLDRELLAEKAMKEQKLKVQIGVYFAFKVSLLTRSRCDLCSLYYLS